MAELIGLALIILGIYLFIEYVLPFAAAGAGIAAVIIACIALLMGLFTALKNYIKAVKQEVHLVHWTWEKGDEPAIRSYFFGPGYVQLGKTIKTAFRFNADSGKKVNATAARFKRTGGIWGACKTIGAWIYQLVSYIIIFLVGTALCAVFSLIHGSITTVFMLLTYVVFSLTWLVDRLYLIKNKIRSDCPHCHSHFLIPYFMCPKCGEIHKKLVPGPYGIWKHTCTCGQKLPSTFFNGRSKLEAFCPNCNASLVASNARPIVFQLVGGSKAGKTVFMAAFFHDYLERLSAKKSVKVTISEQYRPYFQELEQWYQGIDCPATAQLNSQMYPLLIDSDLGVRRQFSIYDIAGEMFDGFTADNEIQQQQFHYCDGLIFLIDPFSSGKLRSDRMQTGEDMSDFSDMAPEDVAANFINYLIRTGHAKANTRCNIPIAVVVAKADVREVKRVVGPAKIQSIMRKNPEKYQTLQQARDEECRNFLFDIGLSATVESLETQFSNLHYFPASAMGHTPDGSEYEPWGVTEAVEWMLPLADKDFANLVSGDIETVDQAV